MSSAGARATLQVGFPRDSRASDPRIILTPKLAAALHAQGFAVMSESGIGERVAITDDALRAAGVKFVDSEQIWKCPLLLKYKAFLPTEVERLNPTQTIGSVFHAEGRPELIEALSRSRVRSYSFEFLSEHGRFPLMRAGGHLAGVQSVLLAAHHLQSTDGGAGILLGRVPGADPVRVLVIGTGNVGAAAAQTAGALGADVVMLAHTEESKRDFLQRTDHPARVLINNPSTLRGELREADVVVGAILVSTYTTDAMITEDDLDLMKPGSVIVDVTCGYGDGYLPTAGPLQHPGDPPRVVRGVLHVKIDVLPALVPVTATHAYSAQATPFLLRLAQAVADGHNDPLWATALITDNGVITHPIVQEHAKIYQSTSA